MEWKEFWLSIALLVAGVICFLIWDPKLKSSEDPVSGNLRALLGGIVFTLLGIWLLLGFFHVIEI